MFSTEICCSFYSFRLRMRVQHHPLLSPLQFCSYVFSFLNWNTVIAVHAERSLDRRNRKEPPPEMPFSDTLLIVAISTCTALLGEGWFHFLSFSLSSFCDCESD